MVDFPLKTIPQLPSDADGLDPGDLVLVFSNGAAKSISFSSLVEILGIAIDIAGKAPLESPALTGTPTAPTAAVGTNSDQLATMAAIKAAIDALVNGAGSSLDQLNELAAALNNDANFAANVLAAISLKANTNSPTLTGVPAAPTQAPGNNSTRIATTAFVQAAVGGNLHKVTYITSSGNFNYDALTKYAEIEVVGGGASGGAAAVSGVDQAASASGGSAGARAIRFKALGAVTSATILIGAGGAMVTSSGGVAANGNNGGNSSYSDGVHTLTGGGGVAGQGANGVSTLGTSIGRPGATASGGVINIPSEPTPNGIAVGSASVSGGILLASSSDGGSGPYGSGGRGGIARGNSSVFAHGENASGYGAGGGGGARIASATGNCDSGAGAPGLVIIREFR